MKKDYRESHLSNCVVKLRKEYEALKKEIDDEASTEPSTSRKRINQD